jgi:hypothetical protein
LPRWKLASRGRNLKKSSTPYVTCLVRGKQIKLTPEEAVRQLYVMMIQEELDYLALTNPVQRSSRWTTTWTAESRSEYTSSHRRSHLAPVESALQAPGYRQPKKDKGEQ